MGKVSPFRLKLKGRAALAAGLCEHVLGLRRLERLYSLVTAGLSPPDFLRQALGLLNIRYELRGRALTSVPPTGPLVVVANHPLGGAEGMALADALLTARPDTKVLTNEFLRELPELKTLFIGVDIIGLSSRCARRQANRKAIEEATLWVKSGGALIVFPAGEVASWNWQACCTEESPWRPTVGHIIVSSKATVVPVYIGGRNSLFFYALGLIHPLLRTAWLVRELINKSRKTITMTIGPAVSPEKLSVHSSATELTRILRLRTLLLAHEKEEGETRSPAQESLKKTSESCQKEEQLAPVSAPVEPHLLAKDIAALPAERLLLDRDDCQVWCASASELPHILEEIGRLREVTFREVGEGSGKSLDLDEYDSRYLHLFLWCTRNRCVVGAYRLGRVDRLVEEYSDVNVLYSRSLFCYDEQFIESLGGPCLEMGRSFVRTEYQKSIRALQLLWKGIGAWVARHPQYRVLFGPVSISREYRDLSRHLMAMSFEENYFDRERADLIKPKDPLKPPKVLPWNREMLAGLGGVEEISELVRLLERDRGVPVLLRQYLKLNGMFVGFNVDRDFHDVLDGLIVVDLMKSSHKVLQRYLGHQEAQAFCLFHTQAAHSASSLQES